MFPSYRRKGGGRKPHATTQPGLRAALKRMIEPTARGSPTSPLRWTIKSTHRLAGELRKQGHAVSATSVRRMLIAMDYSLQGNRKTREGRQYPDRDGQFRRIVHWVKARQRWGEPALSGRAIGVDPVQALIGLAPSRPDVEYLITDGRARKGQVRAHAEIVNLRLVSMGVRLDPSSDPTALCEAVEAVFSMPSSDPVEMGRLAATLYQERFSLKHTLARLRNLP